MANESSYPVLKFGKNEKVDTWKFYEFLHDTKSRGGTYMRQVIANFHPQLAHITELAEQDKMPTIEKYVHSFYEENMEIINKGVGEIKTLWDKYSPTFYKATEKIFINTKWPDGKYIGFASITPPHPRFLTEKTFTYPYNRSDNGVLTTAHEMLHFIFYEFARQKYTPELNNTEEQEMNKLLDNKFSIPLWDLSEAFNIGFLTDDLFHFPFADKDKKGYPNLVDPGIKLRKLWEDNDNDINLVFTQLESQYPLR